MVSVNGDTTLTLELALDKSTSVAVITKDADTLKPFEAAAEKNRKEREKRGKELQKRIEEVDKQLLEAAEKNDVKKVKELTAERKKLSDENLREVRATVEGILREPAVAEGTLTYKDKQWRLVGALRPFDPDAKDKGGKLGTCSIQGEVVSGEFKASEVKSSLAIRAGDLTVVLTGAGGEGVREGRRAGHGDAAAGQSGRCRPGSDEDRGGQEVTRTPEKPVVPDEEGRADDVSAWECRLSRQHSQPPSLRWTGFRLCASLLTG